MPNGDPWSHRHTHVRFEEDDVDGKFSDGFHSETHIVYITFCILVSSADNLQTVSTQIRPDRESGLIWIQTVCHP